MFIASGQERPASSVGAACAALDLGGTVSERTQFHAAPTGLGWTEGRIVSINMALLTELARKFFPGAPEQPGSKSAHADVSELRH